MAGDRYAWTDRLGGPDADSRSEHRRLLFRVPRRRPLALDARGIARAPQHPLDRPRVPAAERTARRRHARTDRARRAHQRRGGAVTLAAPLDLLRPRRHPTRLIPSTPLGARYTTAT